MIERPLPSRIVLVPGMHRSGSSAVARVLGLLGHELPRTLIKDNASNRRGHWESEPVVRLNVESRGDIQLMRDKTDELLERLGTS